MSVPPFFAKRRHLLFAGLALLALVILSHVGWRWVELLGAKWPWDGIDVLSYRAILLLPIAALAWLAFVGFDTHSGVNMIGPQWWRFGWEPWVCFAVLTAGYIVAPHLLSPESVADKLQTYLSPYYEESIGRLAWGWLLASIAVGALTEDLIFRGLLQRALEGTMREGYANVAQALAFELVHLFVYGLAFSGGELLPLGAGARRRVFAHASVGRTVGAAWGGKPNRLPVVRGDVGVAGTGAEVDTRLD
jgi:membrane protease YdiL (CAAX protease family)